MHTFTLFGILEGYENQLKRYNKERKAFRKKTFDLNSDEEDINAKPKTDRAQKREMPLKEGHKYL